MPYVRRHTLKPMVIYAVSQTAYDARRLTGINGVLFGVRHKKPYTYNHGKIVETLSYNLLQSTTIQTLPHKISYTALLKRKQVFPFTTSPPINEYWGTSVVGITLE